MIHALLTDSHNYLSITRKITGTKFKIVGNPFPLGLNIL
jgi:hypothetical protein